jgi:hypothetical protein
MFGSSQTIMESIRHRLGIVFDDIALGFAQKLLPRDIAACDAGLECSLVPLRTATLKQACSGDDQLVQGLPGATNDLLRHWIDLIFKL